jgi:REP-associated tyrosine transposase
LHRDKYKKIIVASLAFLVKQRRVVIYGFVIMPNHIHLIWDIQSPYTCSQVQRDFLKFISQMIKFDMLENHPDELESFHVNSRDRIYQFWQRRPLSIELYTIAVLEQKLNYIHLNPLSGKWQLAQSAEEYFYSSAAYYAGTSEKWGLVSNFYDQ